MSATPEPTLRDALDAEYARGLADGRAMELKAERQRVTRSENAKADKRVAEARERLLELIAPLVEELGAYLEAGW